jgi:carboxypeptidase Q
VLRLSKSWNVIAQTKGGDPENVVHLGAHSDSVKAGPGINDNGSGSLALLEIAEQLSRFNVNNAVRFSWWSGEEEGLLGSEAYVASLSTEELADIRLYLNFDMIASPNFVYAIYDGDGSAFGIVGPPGSAEAQKLFQVYFNETAELPSTASEFNGRSDYGPFLEAGIACGGLETGAEGIKTEEEAAIFGGTAGIAYDPNYHGAGDQVSNLAVEAWFENTKAIAHAVATYGVDLSSLPVNATASVGRRAASKAATHRGGLWIL